MQTDFHEKYLQTNVQTTSPESLVSMLYEGSIKYLNQAKSDLAQKQWEKAHNNIVRSQNIVSELAMSLDKERGKEIARNLDAIYRYVNERLVEADVKKDVRPIDESIDLLGKIRSAWQEAMQKNKRADGAGGNIAY